MFTYNYYSARHVYHRNPLADTDDQLNTCAGSFHNGIGGARTGHKDTGRVGARGCFRFPDGIKDRQVFHHHTTLPRRDSADQVRAGGLHIAGVKLPLAPGDSLHNDPRLIIKQNTHSVDLYLFVSMAATIFWAASRISLPQSSPASLSKAFPSSAPVPESRTTMGMPSGISACAIPHNSHVPIQLDIRQAFLFCLELQQV